MLVKTYPSPVEMTVKSEFVSTYIVYAEDGEDFTECKAYKVGDTVKVLGKVKSDGCVSGYGYIAYDEELIQSFVFETSLLEL
jgi:hypothetical protein